MKEHILVTGGAGYIGSILVPTLLEKGFHVTVVDNFVFRQSSLAHVCHLKTFQLLRGDARDKNLMLPLLKQADIIIPLAALVGAPMCDRDPIATTTTNLDAIRMLVELASPQQRFLVPITNSGYGIGEKGKFCTEETPLRPISLYGRTKVEAEKIILDHKNAISFRLATVFGMAPRIRLDLLVNDFTYRAFKDRFLVLFEGHFKRNYIHIRDVARAFLHGIGHFESLKGQAYNVGLSDANLSKIELCQAIQKQVPHFVFLEAPVGKDPDQRDYIVSNEKIEKTGFRPEYSLDDGIQELLKGFTQVHSAYGNV